jgi:phosphoethanolamine N-methyltransferase
MAGRTPDERDEHQYQDGMIAAYESVYGRDYVSVGGVTTAERFQELLALEAGELVLDVGCGLGGSAFRMAREYEVRVEGVDVSGNMIREATSRATTHGLNDSVAFEQVDILDLECPGRYDAAHAREVFLHIHDKPRLMAALMASLRPGGRLVFTDYMQGPPPHSDTFRAYLDEYHYLLHELEEYRSFLEAAGFVEVVAEDITDLFLEVHQAELAALRRAPIKEPYHSHLEAGWTAKIERARRGEQRWGLFRARRPRP